MENVERGGIGQIQEIGAVTEPGEGKRLAQGCFLDELAGVAFVAITLMWIVSSLAGLMWRDFPADVVTHVQALIRTLSESHAMAILSRVGGALGFVRTVYEFATARIDG